MMGSRLRGVGAFPLLHARFISFYTVHPLDKKTDA